MLKDLPKKLEELRMQYGYSCGEVAEIIGAPSSITVWGYEHDKSPLNVKQFAALCKLYHCSADELLGLKPATEEKTVKFKE